MSEITELIDTMKSTGHYPMFKKQLDAAEARAASLEKQLATVTAERDKELSRANEYRDKWQNDSKYIEEIKTALDCHRAYIVQEIERLQERVREVEP